MTEKILLVDDDPNILAALRRQLRKVFLIDTAPGPREGLEAVRESGPYAVVVSDLRMPGMDGIQFLAKVRTLAPDTVRMMLTGNADLHAAMEAVNEGNVFRFLTKPCPPEVLVKGLWAGIEQYRLILAERELLENTLRGAVKALMEILSLVNPEAFGRASRVTRYAVEVGRKMKVAELWQLETAAALSQIGCIILPEQALRKVYRGESLTQQEERLFQKHPTVAAELLAKIPRMQKIAEIIAYQAKEYNGGGLPRDPRRGDEIPLGSRILKAVLDLDAREARGEPPERALMEMKARRGMYDPAVLGAIEAWIGVETRLVEQTLESPEQLSEGMILAEDVCLSDGRLLVARGYPVNRTMMERLRNFARKPGLKAPLKVLVRNPGGI